MRFASAAVPARRFSTWLDLKPGIPDEHHHSHPRYRGLHLVTPGELDLGHAAFEDSASQISTIRRLLSAFWGPDVTPRRVRRSVRA